MPPLQGLNPWRVPKPRALPWAPASCPVGAGNSPHRRDRQDARAEGERRQVDDAPIGGIVVEGTIAVVDFYVGRKHPQNDLKRHTWSTRNFWRGWLENDNVFPSADHLPYLQRHFETIHVSEYRGKIPYLPLVRAPYYLFIGRKPE